MAESVPAAAAVAGLAAARWIAAGENRIPASARAVLRDRAAGRWVIGESIAYAAWTALLTFLGAHFVTDLAVGESGAGVILAAGAAAYALAATPSGGSAAGSRLAVWSWARRR